MLRELLAIAAGASVLVSACAAEPAGSANEEPAVALPSPMTDGEVSLEEVLANRRSTRTFADRALSPDIVGQLLWSAQGVTSGDRRTAPSAGALYPLEVYVVDDAGAHRYVPADHALRLVVEGDVHGPLADASGQEAVADAPVVVVITGVEARTADRYRDRAERYVTLEAGHAAQNLLLQATALGLAAVPIGSFDDDAVARVLALADGERPLYLLPVGHPGGG